MQLSSNGITIEVDDYPTDRTQNSASPSKLPILLIMGLGMPRTAWPLPFIELLTQAGHRVIRFDNRDIGLSSKLAAWGKPNVIWAGLKLAMGLPVTSTYSLDDMARDAVGVLDALKIPKVHLVGVSMGGMIGQLLAADHSARVASFTCIMSSSGARHLPQPSMAVRRVLFVKPPSKDLEAIVERYMTVLKVIGSPGFPSPDAQLRHRIREHLAPYYFPMGSARQIMAIAANGDRSRKLAQIRCPVQLIHGRADPLIPLPAAYDLKQKISHAELEVIDGMGHDLPPALFGKFSELVLRNCARSL
jgi:pimeloyl-ACP methyl ester carboxylesterase